MPIRHRFNSTVPDGGDTSLVRPSNWNDTHVFPWRQVTAGETLNASDPIAATLATAQTFPLPVTIAAGDVFELRNNSNSAALASIDPGAGRQIQGCPVADTLTLDAGDSVRLVARTTTFFELAGDGAVGPVGPPGAPSLDAHALGVRQGFVAISNTSADGFGMSGVFYQGSPTVTQAALGSDAFNRMVVCQRIAGTTSTTSIASFRLSIPYVLRDRGYEAMLMASPSDGFVSTTRFFLGLHTQFGGFANTDPSAYTNVIGIGYDSADANLQLIHNDGTGTATKVDLGPSLPRSSAFNTDVYRLELSCAPGASSVSYVVRRLNNPVTVSGTITTDLPLGTVEQTFGGALMAGGTSSAPTISLFGLSFKSTY